MTDSAIISFILSPHGSGSKVTRSRVNFGMPFLFRISETRKSSVAVPSASASQTGSRNPVDKKWRWDLKECYPASSRKNCRLSLPAKKVMPLSCYAKIFPSQYHFFTSASLFRPIQLLLSSDFLIPAQDHFVPSISPINPVCTFVVRPNKIPLSVLEFQAT